MPASQEVTPEKTPAPFRPLPLLTTLKRVNVDGPSFPVPETTRKLRPLTITDARTPGGSRDVAPQLSFTGSFTGSTAAARVTWTDAKVSVFGVDEEEEESGRHGHTKAPAGSVSARGTRKEEFEYLTKLFSGSRIKKGPPPWEKAAPDEEDGAAAAPAHNKLLSTQPAKGVHKGKGGEVGEDAGSNRDSRGRLKVPWTLPTYSASHRPLRFRKYGPLYDVATWSVFKESQDFAGNGIAALSSISMDRDVLQRGGAVQYMVDLLLNGKTSEAKCDACQALLGLLKKDEACREFVDWTGHDKDGTPYTSGFKVAFRLRRSKAAQLQRDGADVLHAVLVSSELKHPERITEEYIAGLCAYCQASDQIAACKAAKIIVALFAKVLDTGIWWTMEPIAPVVELFKNTEISSQVRSLLLKAIHTISKEGDRVIGLLAQAGATKTMSLHLAARYSKRLAVDNDDINYVRVLTQICEVDNKRYDDVILIGGTERIIEILRVHLVTHKTLLAVEVEMQRRCMRFLERVLSKPILRLSAFQAGCAQLYLDILEMDKVSLKAQSCECLLSMVQDPKVKELWHKLGNEPSARLAAMLRRLKSPAELQHTVFYIFKSLCSSEETVKLLVGTDMMETTIELMDAAVKNEDRDEMREILAAAVQFLRALVSHKLGVDHVHLWNVVGRIDPNMRKVRGLLVTHECKEDIWIPYDQFLSCTDVF